MKGCRVVLLTLLGVLLCALGAYMILFDKEKTTVGKVASQEIAISVEIPAEYERIAEGHTLVFQIQLHQLGTEYPRRDVILRSYLKSAQGTYEEIGSETVALETQASTVVSYIIPPLKKSEYRLVVEARSLRENELLGEASYQLQTDGIQLSPQHQENKYLVMIAITMGVIVILVTAYFVYILVSRPPEDSFIKRLRHYRQRGDYNGR